MPTIVSVGSKGLPAPGAGFPFDVPVVRALDAMPPLDVDAPVTLLVGENGTGKSTLLEAIAIAAELRALGADDPARDPTLAAQRALAERLRLGWRRRTRRGFFLRAEDFFGWAKARARDDARTARERRTIGWSPEIRASLVDEATGMHVDERDAAARIRDYDARSHGESFLDVFDARVGGDGLFVLDEPEAALSPQRQLAFVALVCDRVATGAQLVIASHAPIMLGLALAVPGARLYALDDGAPRAARWDELPHVTLTRDFVLAPERMLRHLRDAERADDAGDTDPTHHATRGDSTVD